MVTRDAFGYQDEPKDGKQCGDCKHFDDKSTCRLFAAVGRALPKLFDLDTGVKADSYCAAFETATTDWKKALSRTRERF